MFLRHLNEPVGLSQARARPVSLLPSREEDLLAGGVEVRFCHLEVAHPFLDDPPGKHPVSQLLGAAVDLLDEEELRIGPEDLLPVDPQDPILKHHLDVGQRGLAGERVEERLDVVGDRRGPLRGLDLDLFVILAAANIVPGHAHRGARHLGEGIPLGDALADLREDLRDDAVDWRSIVEAAAGVVVDPSRDGDVVVHRHPGDRSHFDPSRGPGLLRKENFLGERNGRGFGRRRRRLLARVFTAAEVMGRDPPPRYHPERQGRPGPQPLWQRRQDSRESLPFRAARPPRAERATPRGVAGTLARALGGDAGAHVSRTPVDGDRRRRPTASLHNHASLLILPNRVDRPPRPLPPLTPSRVGVHDGPWPQLRQCRPSPRPIRDFCPPAFPEAFHDVRQNDPHLRHHPPRRRAVAGGEYESHRKDGDRPGAPATRGRRHRSRLPDRVAGRLRQRPGDRRHDPGRDRLRAGPLQRCRHRPRLGGPPRRGTAADPRFPRHKLDPPRVQTADDRGRSRGPGRRRGAAGTAALPRHRVLAGGRRPHGARLPVPGRGSGDRRRRHDHQHPRHRRLRHAPADAPGHQHPPRAGPGDRPRRDQRPLP